MSLTTTTDIVVIQSNDNHTFNISKEAACQSIVINDLIENIGETDEPIPLMHECCTHENLGKVLIFLEYSQTHQIETDELMNWVNSKGMNGQQPEWFANYINVDQGMLFGILLIADFLNIKNLVNFACLTVANKIKHMTPEEIERAFA